MGICPFVVDRFDGPKSVVDLDAEGSSASVELAVAMVDDGAVHVDWIAAWGFGAGKDLGDTAGEEVADVVVNGMVVM